MDLIARDRTLIAWAVLISATALSWWLGTDHGFDDPRIAAVAVLFVGFFKVRLVGLYFMELRLSPPVLRALFEGWCLVVCGAVVTLYLVL